MPVANAELASNIWPAAVLNRRRSAQSVVRAIPRSSGLHSVPLAAAAVIRLSVPPAPVRSAPVQKMGHVRSIINPHSKERARWETVTVTVWVLIHSRLIWEPAGIRSNNPELNTCFSGKNQGSFNSCLVRRSVNIHQERVFSRTAPDRS